MSVVIHLCKPNVFEREMPESIEDFRFAFAAVLEILEEFLEKVFVQIVSTMLANRLDSASAWSITAAEPASSETPAK